MVKLIPPAVAYREAGKKGKFHFARRGIDPVKEWFVPAVEGSFITMCSYILWHPERVDVATLAPGKICGKCLGAIQELPTASDRELDDALVKNDLVKVKK